MKRILELTETLTNAFGAPGYEDDVLELIKNIDDMKYEKRFYK